MSEQQMQEGYIRASLRERYLINELLKQNQDFEILTITKSTGYEKYDAVISSGDTEYIVECKVRLTDFNPAYGYMIEKDKYDYLMSAYKKNGLIPLYVNFFNNGTICWNLLQQEVKFEKGFYPSNSIGNAYLKEKINADLYVCNATGRWNNPMPITTATLKSEKQYNKYFNK